MSCIIICWMALITTIFIILVSIFYVVLKWLIILTLILMVSQFLGIINGNLIQMVILALRWIFRIVILFWWYALWIFSLRRRRCHHTMALSYTRYGI